MTNHLYIRRNKFILYIAHAPHFYTTRFTTQCTFKTVSVIFSNRYIEKYH